MGSSSLPSKAALPVSSISVCFFFRSDTVLDTFTPAFMNFITSLRSRLTCRLNRRQAALAKRMRPCRVVPEVEEWEKTFDEIEFRYNFLVLDGPSKMGKTLYCRSRSLDRPGQLLEVDCAGADTPDLTKYEFGVHKMILCDEGSADMVLRYKKNCSRRAHPSKDWHHPSRTAMHMICGRIV